MIFYARLHIKTTGVDYLCIELQDIWATKVFDLYDTGYNSFHRTLIGF